MMDFRAETCSIGLTNIKRVAMSGCYKRHFHHSFITTQPRVSVHLQDHHQAVKKESLKNENMHTKCKLYLFVRFNKLLKIS